jgi:hypothetical protein
VGKWKSLHNLELSAPILYSGKTLQVKCKILHLHSANISGIIILISAKFGVQKLRKYTQEDKEVVKLLLEQGMSPRGVSAETDIPEGTINGWKGKWGIRHKNSYKDLYKGTVGEVQQRLIKIMQEAPEVCYNYFNSANSGVPPATTYRKYFGSWTAAREAAGVVAKEEGRGHSIQKEDKITLLYLVEFEDFYKIGITQQTVDQRLGKRYPAYKILWTKEFNTLAEAKREEARLLTEVKHKQYIPTNFPAEGRGFTECFKMAESEFEEFFQKML